MRGKFIVFEGIDGAGKTTQAKLLAKKINESGGKAHLTAEPTELPSGKLLRQALGGEIKKSDCEMALLFALDRVAHNNDPQSGIERLLSDGFDVICDRYYYSSLAYQGSATDYGWVKALNIGCPEIRTPDLCVFLDLTPQQSLNRIRRGRDRLEIYENEETLERVRKSFFAVFTDLYDNVAVLDANRDENEIAEDIFGLYRNVNNY